MTRLERRAHQIVVDALLEELADERRELYRRQAFGVSAAGARAVKEELQRAQERLRHYVDQRYV